jgi:phosphoribosylamine-glycine ligase
LYLPTVLSAGRDATALRQARRPPLQNLSAAQAAAYAAVEKIHFDGAQFPRDIRGRRFEMES